MSTLIERGQQIKQVFESAGITVTKLSDDPEDRIVNVYIPYDRARIIFRSSGLIVVLTPPNFLEGFIEKTLVQESKLENILICTFFRSNSNQQFYECLLQDPEITHLSFSFQFNIDYDLAIEPVVQIAHRVKDSISLVWASV